MAIFALIDSSNKIVNRVVVDDIKSWIIPDGFRVVEETGTTLEIGGSMIGDVYSAPIKPRPQTVIFDELDSIVPIIFRILFNHENRIRALEGKQAITAAQFRTAIKALT